VYYTEHTTRDAGSSRSTVKVRWFVQQSEGCWHVRCMSEDARYEYILDKYPTRKQLLVVITTLSYKMEKLCADN